MIIGLWLQLVASALQVITNPRDPDLYYQDLIANHNQDDTFASQLGRQLVSSNQVWDQ